MKQRAGRTLSAADLSAFCLQLGVLLRAGVQLSDGIALLCGTTRKGRLKRALGSLQSNVEDGKSLAAAMEQSGAFPIYLIRMTQAGELSGDLDGVMDAMAGFYEREQKMTEQIRNAVVYPLLLIVMMAAVVCFIIIQVLPMFRDILTGLGGELPGSIAVMIQLGAFLQQNWQVLVAVIAGIVIACFVVRGTGGGRLFFGRLTAKFLLVRKIAAARFAGSMSFLLAGGIPMDTTLELSCDMLDNPFLAGRLETALLQVPNGVTVAEAIESADIFPEKFNKMLAVGFHGGDADSIMSKLSEIYESETNRALERLAGYIEPALSAVLYVIVGMILVSVILPLIQIMSLIG